MMTEKRKYRKTKKLFLGFSVFLFLSFFVYNPANAATFDSNLLPGITNTFDLGLSSTRWQDLYLSRNILIGGSLLTGNLATDPAGSNGMIYYSTASSTLRAYQSGKWNDLGRWNFSASTNSIYNNNAGNVGIGTSNPSQKLEVNGTVQTTGFRLTTGAQNGYILTSDGSGFGTWQEPEGQDIYWISSGDNIYSVNSGNIGVGTSSPQQKLHVYNGTLLIDTTPSMGADIDSADIGNIESNSVTTANLTLGNNLYVRNSFNVGSGGISSAGEISAASYLKIGRILTSPPINFDCDEEVERGRMAVDKSNFRLYICNGAGRKWDYIQLND
ncbi:MAG: hypothetical protein HZB99_00570 [Candidatus Harrisonbacteria bacterium]|nr:hypothetical protein [Candidatus Harrisonbacteria bacterium]